MQGSLLNVSNLARSLQFYQDVFGLRLASRADRIAALMIHEGERQQVLLLREAGGPHPVYPGRGGIGLRLLALEAGSPAELDAVEERLQRRQALIGRRRTETWEAVVGIDPDRIEVSVSSGRAGVPIQSEHWAQLDEMVYLLGE
ncbi:MAG: VOC family protein [Actinobacteria bacterium]|nr:VOC family protein [Actinomycetota bacterium]